MTRQFEKVADQDREALVSFMMDHAPSLMFPLTNMTRYGLGGDHPRSISAWVLKHGKLITDVLTISREHMVFPCCPTAPWAAAQAVIAGRAVKGFIGNGPEVAALRSLARLTHKATLDAVEPAFALDLVDLQMPNTTGFALRPFGAAPEDLLIKWRAAYEVETLSVAPDVAAVSATKQVRHAMATDSHRVLFAGDRPVAVTGFNAQMPEIVQIGGVYTPPELRGRGFARTALALHLQEVCIEGVERAVLSAANAAAARVYRALGFQQTGEFALVIFDDLQVAYG